MCMMLLEEKKCNNVLEKFKQDLFLILYIAALQKLPNIVYEITRPNT
jgi:hypothetical protein